ncbi:bifunctional diguanylate cyclase/phosphodiesterase [Superficieibacter electus]|uniref:Bifunctional diguanylate cyclase/phosphodiesterase n=1 Tax=Superficieibacter electus TaxID=2022662 RepID=A0A2P5GTH8_9ENTR|nr:EAL domain-containing protein [Superficieibacter electus]POP46394.1 bifunctional diguanylate cyclase/phosphodiesterase [Superficieibacter electus]POP49865.1 bifunctional diguanylate cyclase/phosphodiesterase [Superficieibacter electus]
MSWPIPDNEQARLAALATYQQLDTLPEENFDRLAGLAARLFDVPIVLVSLVASDRQFFKAQIGFCATETSREISFCAHTIMQDEILVILDAATDPRFATNPLVLGPPFMRFYAGKPLVTPTGEKIGTVCLIDSQPHETFTRSERQNLTDITALVMERMEMRRLESLRSASLSRFKKIAETSPDAIICSNAEGNITFWNRSAERLFGYTAEEVLNRSSRVIVPESWLRIYEDEIERLRHGQQLALADKTIELSALRKDGSEFPAEFSLSTWHEGQLTNVGAIVRDITERQENEARLFRMASLDALTDLPNRAAWRQCVVSFMQEARVGAMLLLDLDGFKEVNDTQGHLAGDAVLKEVGLRLRSHFDEAVIIARLGGDEFVVLLNDNDLRLVRSIAVQIIATLSEPYEFAGQHIEIGVSVGIALTPQHATRPEELLSAADLALYRAKAAGKGRYALFEPAFRDVAVNRRRFKSELKQAFENQEFELFYQPQFNTATGALVGAEALLRWNHPQRGLLTPPSFIETLNNKPSAPAIGEWILRTACAQAAEWRAIVPHFRIGVNLFEAQFRSRKLIEVVNEILTQLALPAEAVELEITENILLRHDAATLSLLQALRQSGVGLAFDDYGTGYASLSFLKRFPMTRLKIDRSFIRDVHTDPGSEAVVRAILYLGRSFGMAVIAEGVETTAQLAFLKNHHCPEVQGYLLGRPLPAAAFRDTFLAT